MEHTRLVCYFIAMQNWDSKKQPIPDVKDFMPLPTDSKEKEEDPETHEQKLLSLLEKVEEQNKRKRELH